MKKLLKTILARVRKKPFSFQTFEDLYYMCKEAMKEDTALGVEYLKLLSAEIEKAFRDSSLTEADVHNLYDLHGDNTAILVDDLGNALIANWKYKEV